MKAKSNSSETTAALGDIRACSKACHIPVNNARLIVLMMKVSDDRQPWANSASRCSSTRPRGIAKNQSSGPCNYTYAEASWEHELNEFQHVVDASSSIQDYLTVFLQWFFWSPYIPDERYRLGMYLLTCRFLHGNRKQTPL